eukprot:Anaeramoba_ignava/a607479_110.p1 GENE.a607479_110~~a607479_110.p1  ORF type:complete len:790 (+),score=174.80 a607479_110:432-2801(+)
MTDNDLLAKKHQQDNQQPQSQVKIAPSLVPTPKFGTKGTKINLITNYFPLNASTGQTYQYRVSFDPPVLSRRPRSRMLEIIKKSMSPFVYDGGELVYSKERFEDFTKEISFRRTATKISFQHTNIITPTDTYSISQVLNITFSLVLQALGLQQIRRNYFDSKKSIKDERSHSELWQGYQTTIYDTKAGLCLNLDILNKIIRTDTVYDKLSTLYSDYYHQYSHRELDFRDRGFQDFIRKNLKEQSVMTLYNNRFYTITDLDFSKNPNYEFKFKDKTISLYRYYQDTYHLKIKNGSQPLLLIKKETKTSDGQKSHNLIYLIPELCYMAGGTAKKAPVPKPFMRHVHVPPRERIQRLLDFIKQMNSDRNSQEILKLWQFQVQSMYCKVTGRVLPSQKIMVQDRTITPDQTANWKKDMRNVKLIKTLKFPKWVIFHSPNFNTRQFESEISKISKGLEIPFGKPKTVSCRFDHYDEFSSKIRDELTSDCSLAVFILPDSRKDHYDMIKHETATRIPIPTQCILGSTISDPKKLSAVCGQIIMQVNCKAGGALWGIGLPKRDIMYVGIDSARDSQNKTKSITAIVSSTNSQCTEYYSSIVIQQPRQESITGLTEVFHKALDQYYLKNKGKPPGHLIIYRDGVTDPQIQLVLEKEIPQIQEGCRKCSPKYKPHITYVVVQKRIKTRFFDGDNNPPPGTILDQDITTPNRFDFFLVPQKVNMGSATPVHFTCVYDSANIPADALQEVTFQLCHLYYNWSGTVRVPAVCQYAHKLSFLVGQSIHQEVHSHLHDKLYFL